MRDHSLFPQCRLLLLFLLITLTQLCPKAESAACHVDDESGLLGFKSDITADPSGLIASWKRGTNCCTWHGIKCRDGTRVTSISISGHPGPGKPNNSLSGVISSSLTKVKFLEGIYFRDLHHLTGPFPDILFVLPNIKYVYIEGSKLSGPIPKSIGNLTRLRALSLARNRFTGPIPSSISKLTQLTQLNLAGNLLTGTVPARIQHLHKLTLLSLDGNKLSGPIPNFFRTFSNLRILRLQHNKFTGEIPTSIEPLAPNLAFLDLGHNLLTGKIPDFLGKFKALDALILAHNNLSGAVPKSFANLTKIFNLDLAHNNLVDPFPELNVKGIESLDLSYNKFHLNKIPKWVISSPIIFSLKLAKCGLKIRLDHFNPSETYFYEIIDLSENKIRGSPVTLLNRMDYLVSFKASGNKLRFNLESLRIVNTLKELDLSRNLVFGKVPKAVSALDRLNVSYNHLHGAIPASATKFPASSFVGNDGLCGAPLPPCKGLLSV